MYVSLVCVAFEVRATLQRTAQMICGHESLAESLAYGNVSLLNAESIRDEFGPLLLKRGREDCSALELLREYDSD
jgi:hypothetical protein